MFFYRQVLWPKTTQENGVLWYTLPALLNIIGRVIAYLVLKNDDPSKAKTALGLGIILFASYAGYYILFSVRLEMFKIS